MDANNTTIRLAVLSKNLNITIEKICSILKEKKENIKPDPNQKLTRKQVEIIEKYISETKQEKPQ